jgi:hypothetical protein
VRSSACRRISQNERAQHNDDGAVKIRVKRKLFTQHDDSQRANTVSCCREHAVSRSDDPSLTPAIPEAQAAPGSADSQVSPSGI